MIVAAAIRQSGKVYTGKRHCECISEMVALGYSTPIKGEQGFVDDTGAFLDRHAAGEHAIVCGQIERMRWPGMGLDSVEIFPRNK
jgi:hypothetical protein